MTKATIGTGVTEYSYYPDGRRATKNTDETIISHAWDGSNIVADTKNNEITKYIRSFKLEYAESGETKKEYRHNSHGDVYRFGDNKYGYDAFGNSYYDENISYNELPDPFGYCGEYYDNETGLIYLRNRYYNPQTGRFVSEDPVKDGVNWYVYCNSNPVNLIDPLGLFDFDDRLGPSLKYNIDVEVLQNELAWLGYYSGEIDGYFGQKTLDAVNAYKSAMGLGNTGSDWGVVGKQTWEFMGLIYRTQKDIDIGVEIFTDELKQYKDFSLSINNALKTTVSVAESKGRFNYKWFVSQVDHEAPWDIKREKSWNKTIGNNTYPGWGVQVKYNGNLMTPEEIGNYTYGYIGSAMGITTAELYVGSWYAAGFPIGGADWTNEYNDWIFINKGARAYKK